MLVGGRYEIENDVQNRLGAGTVGMVYVAHDRRIGRRVACKLVRRPHHGDPEAQEAFERLWVEARAAGGLSHPNIVTVHDFGEDEELSWIVMELVEGQSLRQLLDSHSHSHSHSHSPLAIAEAVRIMREILAALSFSHGQGVVHRDIKPANILLTQSGQVKIVDFGIARLRDSTRTIIGTVLGTPAYMAPEQLRGDPADHRADIWSAGVVLYELLTGEKPFSGNPDSVIHRALFVNPPAPSLVAKSVPYAFDAVIARALAKSVDARYQSAAAFAEAVSSAAADHDATLHKAAAEKHRWVLHAFGAGRSRKLRQLLWRGKRDALVAIGATLLLAGVVGAVLTYGVAGQRTANEGMQRDGEELQRQQAAEAQRPQAERLQQQVEQTQRRQVEASQRQQAEEIRWQSEELQRRQVEASHRQQAEEIRRQAEELQRRQVEAFQRQQAEETRRQAEALQQGEAEDARRREAEAYTVMPLPASVRAAPDGSASISRRVSKGTRVRLFAQSGSWFQIGDQEPWGWVHESRLPTETRAPMPVTKDLQRSVTDNPDTPTDQSPPPGEAFAMPMPASVRAGPDMSAPVLRSVGRDTSVHVFARSGAWLQIGDREPWGWIHESRVPAELRQGSATR